MERRIDCKKGSVTVQAVDQAWTHIRVRHQRGTWPFTTDVTQLGTDMSGSSQVCSQLLGLWGTTGISIGVRSVEIYWIDAPTM